MAAAARLSARARPLSRPNPAVAALLVRDGRLISRGWTQPGGRPHAEAHLLDRLTAATNADASSIRDAALYVTLEPCAHDSPRGPACADLVAQAKAAECRIARVVIGQRDPDPRTAGAGIAMLERAGIAVTVLDDSASAISLAAYLTRQRLGRPYVTLKLAVSLDGAIALADGSSRWITGDMARSHVHARRAQADAILVGGATWRGDTPRLDVRLPGLSDRSPRRYVLTRGEAPEGAQAIGSPEAIADIADALTLYVEGGAATAASFVARDLVDELHLYRAPILIGAGRRALGDIGLSDLAAAHGRWQITERRQLGSDEFTAYRRIRAS